MLEETGGPNETFCWAPLSPPGAQFGQPLICIHCDDGCTDDKVTRWVGVSHKLLDKTDTVPCENVASLIVMFLDFAPGYAGGV